MKTPIPRRDFLKAVPVAAYALTRAAQGSPAPPPEVEAKASLKMQPFDYQGVRLLPSLFQDQVQGARATYLSISDDDILHGYRLAAGLPAPGQTLGGWCRTNSSTVFGQWLSGMARLHRATGDTAIRDKAAGLFTEWAKTVKPDGDCGMRHYPFDKLVGGLVDLKMYADLDEAIPMLDRVTAWAAKNFSRENVAGADQPGLYSGRPGEWYTLSENLYRAWQLTGNSFYKDFAAAWHYDAYWNKFARNATPDISPRLHAYSHVNTFSSAAMAYAATGDEKYLRVIKNAHDWLQNFQCFATGGFGPGEDMMSPDGGRGRALDTCKDTFETGCGSWAVFKLTRYLLQFTGDAHYGDWAERILYNGIGAALPMTKEGKNFYYSDYRVGGGSKIYYQAAFACCAGTYIQAVSDYHNVIYYKDASGLYVNLYVPSEANWAGPGWDVKLRQETNYPASDSSAFTIQLENNSYRFALNFRIPAWARHASLQINGGDATIRCAPGTWAKVERVWHSGDRVELRLPQPLRIAAVDAQHPKRAAVVRGPVVLVLEDQQDDPDFRLPDSAADLEHWLAPAPTPGYFTFRARDGSRSKARFRPFYSVAEKYPYRMYFDT